MTYYDELMELKRQALKSLREAEAKLITARALAKVPNPNLESALAKVRIAIKKFESPLD